MLIPNLSVLLAERRLTLSRVSEDTHISRTTLTALCGRGAKGVQFDTLNTLCQYLRVAPGDLFAYRPFDVAVSAPGALGRGAVAFTVSRAGRRPEQYALDCDARLEAPGDTLRVRLSLPADAEAAARAGELVELLRALPAPALNDLEAQILRAYDARLDKSRLPDDDYSPDLTWPWS